jgi:protein phosphatase 2C family protein 2/3
MSSQEVIDFVSTRIYQKLSLAQICEEIADNCLAPDCRSGLGCDNMTVLICALLNGQTFDEWTKKISDRISLEQ